VRSAAQVQARAQRCAEELRRIELTDTRAAAMALRIEPGRLAPLHGTSAERREIRETIEERLAEVHDQAAAAIALTSLWSEGTASPTAALVRVHGERRAADDLCRAAAALRTTLPDERLANLPGIP
jgi:hypothetical protein